MKGREGTARAEAAARVLDQRLGVLVREMREAGELKQSSGRPAESDESCNLAGLGLDQRDVAEAVAMVEHADLVAEVMVTR